MGAGESTTGTTRSAQVRVTRASRFRHEWTLYYKAREPRTGSALTRRGALRQAQRLFEHQLRYEAAQIAAPTYTIQATV